MPIFVTQPPETTMEAIGKQLKPEIEIVSPVYETVNADSSKTLHFYDALEMSEKGPESGFEMKTAQAGITTNGDIKDRIIVGANLSDVVRYKGLHEAFQNDVSPLDDVCFRNEIYIEKLGKDFTPIAVIKVKIDSNLYVKDAKIGISNATIPEKLFGKDNGRIHVTTDINEITGYLSFLKRFSDNFLIDVAGEATAGKEKPFLYIEGELQKYLESGAYIFLRGEVDNQGLENKLVLGIGYGF